MAKMSGSGRALSKSKFMAGLQCQKRLYLEVFAPEERAETSAATERQFDEGHDRTRTEIDCWRFGYGRDSS